MKGIAFAMFGSLMLIACGDSSTGSDGNGKIDDALEGVWLEANPDVFGPDTAKISEDRVDIPGIVSGNIFVIKDNLIGTGNSEPDGEYQFINDTLWMEGFSADTIDGVIDTTTASAWIRI